MSYEIVGAVYDGMGNVIDQDEYENAIAMRVVDAISGLSPADVGAANPLANLLGRRQSASPMLGGNRNVLLQALRSPNIRAATAQIAARAQGIIPAAPGPVDETPLPIDSGAGIAAGATAVISVNSQIIFRPRRLIVGPSIASFFTVDDMRVGNVPLTAGVGAITAEAFTPDSVNPNVRKVTANPGVAISLTVTNIDGLAHRFRGVFFGEGSQPEGCRAF